VPAAETGQPQKPDVGKYTHLDADPGSSHSMVTALVPRGAQVLEFGCATGYMSRMLTEGLGCTVSGVELFPAAAELAKPHCRRVIVGDVETMDLAAALGDQRFDAVLFADVLEHLRDPGAVLARVRPFIADGGAVIASIPNVAHGSVRLALLHGEFRYRQTGLLDNTHLRFFTREGVRDLFEGAGYHVTHWRRTVKAVGDTDVTFPDSPMARRAKRWLAQDPDSTTFQFIVRAERSDVSEELRRTRDELARAKASLDAIWGERVKATAADLARLVPAGEALVLNDEAQIGPDVAPGRRVHSFPDHDGQYWGPPANADAAKEEVERLRAAGARYFAVAWPAFWQLELFPAFARYLRDSYACLYENDRLILFDLRTTGPRS
jgi:2-polyprenyl-3-methyl-5-hydroxy-6-metoxy-1,4-benzoquinol methylase